MVTGRRGSLIASDENYPELDRHTCRLLGPIALVVQALMGVLVILSLVYKRHREKPMRPWRIWMFDVSKQVAGQMFVHGVNVFISDRVAHHSSGNPCVMYFLNILIDTTFGVAVIYFILRIMTDLLTNKLNLTGLQSGQYGDPPSMSYWARQAAVYVLALTTMKLVVVGIFALWPGIFKLGDWLLSWTGGGDAVQVIFVMGLFPIAMNVLQFWLIDSIVKASTTASGISLPGHTPRNSADHEPLFNAPETDDDDDEGNSLPVLVHDIENPRLHPPQLENRSLHDVEQKSSGASSSSRQKDSDDHHDGIHAYPPSGSTSPDLSLSLSSLPRLSGAPRSQTSRRLSRKSPPPPLLPQPPLAQSIIISSTPISTTELPMTIARSTDVDSPQRSPIARRSVEKQKHAVTNSKDWGLSWDDSDDWADRVGEEDWTGRRLESKRGAIGETWDASERHVEEVGL